MKQPYQDVPRTIIAWPNVIAMALEADGVSSRELFEIADIPYQTAADPSVRVEAEKVKKLFQLAVERTGNPAFGLRTATFLQPTTFHALGFSLYASSSLQEFFQRIVRFFKLLSDNAQHQLMENEDHFEFIVDRTNPDLSWETVDGWIGSIVFMCRNISRPDFAPLRLELLRPEPESHAEDFERYFRCPVTFSAPQNVLHVSKVDVLSTLPSGDTELARRNDQIVMEHLARLESSDIVRQVETKIVELLPTGTCSKDKIASLLHVSQRNLHYKLEARDTNFQAILENIRTELALQYIKQQNLSISEITYLLGFSDVSNFTRAFKRWTGSSPSKYRQEKIRG